MGGGGIIVVKRKLKDGGWLTTQKERIKIDDLKLQADVVDSPWYEDPDKRHRRRYQTFEVEYEGGVCRLMDHAKFHTEKTPRYLELVRRWEQAGQLNEARKLKTDVPTKTPATP